MGINGLYHVILDVYIPAFSALGVWLGEHMWGSYGNSKASLVRGLTGTQKSRCHAFTAALIYG